MLNSLLQHAAAPVTRTAPCPATSPPCQATIRRSCRLLSRSACAAHPAPNLTRSPGRRVPTLRPPPHPCARTHTNTHVQATSTPPTTCLCSTRLAMFPTSRPAQFHFHTTSEHLISGEASSPFAVFPLSAGRQAVQRRYACSLCPSLCEALPEVLAVLLGGTQSRCCAMKLCNWENCSRMYQCP